ncbi:unnamed protein product, partial [Diamesa tonsa]
TPKHELTSFNTSFFLNIYFFPNADGCEYFWTCVAEKVELGKCKDDMWFDSIDLVCDYEDITCYEPESGEIIEEIPNPDSECPPRGGTNVVFLPSKNCNEYYICVNGVPNVASCSPGNHWNPDRQFCDHPASAGCTNVGPNTPLPDCEVGFTGAVPHPWNCNWFIFCSNGNRSQQQCPHLQHFDVELRRCLLLTTATCIKDL